MYKKIGVIITQAPGAYQIELIKGIKKQAFSLGYDVLVFTTFVKQFSHADYEYGEKNIFNLINFDMLDGLIVAGDTLKIRGLPEELFPRLLNECKCPVVFVDYCNDMGFDNITSNDSVAFEEIVDHLIDTHGCRNILFYSGPYEVSTTQTRFEGYKKSLKKHNIELNPDFYSFDGDFWIESGQQVAHEILDGKRPRPDAITFCGDNMAAAAMDVFKSAGWKIPDDIIITGYDAEDVSLRCIPPLTSYTPPVSSTGANAVIALDAKIKGEPPKPPVPSRGRLELGGSCGCCEDFRYTKRIYYKDETSLNYDMFLNSSMMEDLAETKNFDDLLSKILYFLYLIPDWKSFYLCLCNDWLNSEISDEDFLTDGYTDQMILHVKACEESRRIVHESFDTKLMLPALYEERENPTCFFFIPLHIAKRCLGYSVLSYGNKVKTFDINYMTWTKHVCNALERFRLHSKLARIAYVDLLTGTYTRAGIQRDIHMLMEHVHDENYRFLVMVIDMDRLKTINDTLGHQSGDMAIHEMARILLSSRDELEICSRTGGDEFVILGCNNYPDDKVEDMIRKISSKIKKVNKSGKLNFTLSASIGGVLGKISTAQDIDALYHEADRKMYEMKAIHHENED